MHCAEIRNVLNYFGHKRFVMFRFFHKMIYSDGLGFDSTILKNVAIYCLIFY